MKQLLTINDLASELKVKTSWIRSMVFYRRIPYLKIGKHIRFELSAIEQWLSESSCSLEGGTK